MSKLEYLSEIIPIGRDNAIPRRELSVLLNLPDRETRLLVERLRRMGNVICSDEGGYFRPSCLEELRVYVRKCRKRRQSEYQINKAAEKLLKRWEQQAEFDGGSLLEFGGDVCG